MMSIDSAHYLNELRSIRGYRASGIMSFTGQILVSDSVDPQINLNAVGSAFNDTFLVAHEATAEVGLEAATEIFIETSRQWIAMICSGMEAKAHIHLLVILDKEGNLALIRITMEKLLPRLMEDEPLLRKISSGEAEAAQEIALTAQGVAPAGYTEAVIEPKEQAIGKVAAARRTKDVKLPEVTQPDTFPGLIEALIVYDSSVVGKKMELEFDKLNIQPDFAGSIKKAIQLLNIKRYDVVFTGITLPDGNGYQICRMIKKDHAKKHCVVIALSGNPSPYERVRSKLAGCDDYFSIHAVTSDNLAFLIKRHISPS